MTDTAAVEHILAAAHLARRPARRATAAQRAIQLRAIAQGLDDGAAELAELAHRETALPLPRLRNELVRTAFQARLFAERLEQGTLFEVRIDPADPDWPMGPRPDIRRSHVPIGPVLVFAASNFPFAFSVAGGDTVSALAAGCPVVVKAHEGHPELSRATARIVTERLRDAGASEGVFGLIEGKQAGITAVLDKRIRAVGFTGSEAGGRALFDLAVSRPDPIPFYGELGSTNPVLVTRAGWAQRADEIVTGFTESATMGTGQFCTQPGVVLVPDVAGFLDRLDLPAVGPMLNPRISDGFGAALAAVAKHPDIETARTGPSAPDAPAAHILTTTVRAVLADPALVTTEIFGPASVLVEYDDPGQALAVLELIEGSLTATVQGADGVDDQAAAAIDLLTERTGRIVWNQWPTGVTVSDAQQHGGPWPATTAPVSTSVGTAAALRFARPVAYQNLPTAMLPEELRG
ncbi:aldehyde dehydrogenase (NADP(+)) [Nocardia carnea]|uniref:aldehyde dehydrogenase (NADP(+)) n=1 Tax=Nocardia carnea TaxID=37328 RepID=UPI0024581829|nr:aldehyde dehydrogenase (NADP(+)) [Nocardia carnea]